MRDEFGYETVARSLQAVSDAPVFGVLGNANMLIFSTLESWGDSRLVSARHEAAAVAMADGYARASGGVGVSTVTCGPGLSHVATSLLAAARGKSPQVLITGDNSRRDPTQLQVFDNHAFANVCESGFVAVDRIEDIGDATIEAFARAELERRPVLLSIPEDLQKEQRSQPAEVWVEREKTAVPWSPGGRANDFAVAALVTALAEAERPVIVCGLGCSSEAAERVRDVAEWAGALLATTLPRKGLFAGEPWDIGICGGFASRVGEALLGQADLVVGVGASIGHFTADGGRLFPQARVVRVTLEREADDALLGRQTVIGDAVSTLAAVDTELRRRPGGPKLGFRTLETAAFLAEGTSVVAREVPEDGLDPREVVRMLAPHLPEDAQIVLGGGHFWTFPIMYITGGPGQSWIFSYQFGAIGQTLAIAIGAWFADPSRPVVLFDGDGSLIQHIQELDTAARYQIPMTVLLGNDSGFGAEFHKLEPYGLASTVVQFPSPDFSKIANAFGGTGRRIDTYEDLERAMPLVTDGAGLRLLDIRISPTVPGDPYARWHYGIPNAAPHLTR